VFTKNRDNRKKNNKKVVTVFINFKYKNCNKNPNKNLHQNVAIVDNEPINSTQNRRVTTFYQYMSEMSGTYTEVVLEVVVQNVNAGNAGYHLRNNVTPTRSTLLTLYTKPTQLPDTQPEN